MKKKKKSPSLSPGGWGAPQDDTSGKESACQCRRCKRHGFDLWVWKIPWRRAWQPTPVFLPGESHGQRNLAGSTAHRILKSQTRLKWLSMQHVSIQYVFYQAFFSNVREKFKKSRVRNSFYWTTAWHLRIDIISFHGHWMHKFLQSLCRACAVITSTPRIPEVKFPGQAPLQHSSAAKSRSDCCSLQISSPHYFRLRCPTISESDGINFDGYHSWVHLSSL